LIRVYHLSLVAFVGCRRPTATKRAVIAPVCTILVE
jgi:hypothetical protein